MSYADSWNKIVVQVKKNINSKEEIVQASWELLFSTIFNYPDSDIDSQRSVKMGVMKKRADIVVKNGGEDLFIVELKRHALHEGQEQLFSYLNQLKVDLGVLVCDNLYVYDYDFTAKNDAYSVLEIPFANDDSNGARFVELFCKENFDKQKIKDFINEGNAKKQAESDMKNELSSELAVRLLKEYFAKKYPTIEKAQIEKILAGYNVSVSKKSLYSPAPVPQSINENFSNTISTSPEIILMIGDRVVSSSEFKSKLLEKRVAKRIWYYENKTEEDVWEARDFKSESGLIGNIRSTKFRHWRTSKLKKLVCIISE